MCILLNVYKQNVYNLFIFILKLIRTEFLYLRFKEFCPIERVLFLQLHYINIYL